MASPPSSYWPCHCQLLRDAQLGPCTLPACSNCPLPERRPFPDLGEQLSPRCYYTLGSQRGLESQLCQGPLLSQQRTSRKAVSLFSEGGSSRPPKRLPSSCPVPDFSSQESELEAPNSICSLCRKRHVCTTTCNPIHLLLGVYTRFRPGSHNMGQGSCAGVTAQTLGNTPPSPCAHLHPCGGVQVWGPRTLKSHRVHPRS